ncbi:MAG: hypothetical protein LBV46_00185 [Bacteroidales bacterium]|jgi:predicted transcriptional regulator|nr:hypothetical protein [Bacteroidales bacterium]
MKNKSEKIQSFVESLEMNQLSEKQQMTLLVNAESSMGGDGSVNGSCVNESSCAHSVNERHCSNHKDKCQDALNNRRCKEKKIKTTPS